MSIAITPKHTPSEAETKQDALNVATTELSFAARNLMTTIAITRSAGARVVHGGTIEQTNEVFATQPDGGVGLVVEDILLAVLGARNADIPGLAPEQVAAATQSPVPAGRNLVVTGADVDVFKASLVTLIAQFEAGATGVSVSTHPSAK